MNKAELVEAVAKNTELTKVDAQRALETILSNVVSGAKKEPVQLVGFGTFKMSKRKARAGINPQTGDKIKIPARTVMTFKASKNPKY
ncbi:DNA-binding protein HU [Candidatus Woesearchaeota archaeon]|nr:DNA-binding protein HU [Candidatus Woesearchaeota archaeon]